MKTNREDFAQNGSPRQNDTPKEVLKRAPKILAKQLLHVNARLSAPLPMDDLRYLDEANGYVECTLSQIHAAQDAAMASPSDIGRRTLRLLIEIGEHIAQARKGVELSYFESSDTSGMGIEVKRVHVEASRRWGTILALLAEEIDGLYGVDERRAEDGQDDCALRAELLSLPKSDQDEVLRRDASVFPTPKGAKWRDVQIMFRDEHKVAIRVLDAGATVLFSDMGMSKQNREPNVQWKTLREFSEARNHTIEKSRFAQKDIPALKKRVNRLSAVLKKYFRIGGEPIVTLEDNTGWQCLIQFGCEFRM